MALNLADRVKETTTTTGTGTITLAGAVVGYQSFAAIGNGNTTYYAIAGQGTNEWEVGIGTYTSAGTTLSRDTVLASSNAGALVNFSAATKDVFSAYPSAKAVYANGTTIVAPSGALLPVANGGTGQSTALIPANTAMLFKQTAAPTGWTKVTTDNDAALRVVSGTAGTGGTVAFTTAFTSQAVTGSVGTSGSTTATGSVADTGSTTATGTVGTSGSTTATGTNATVTGTVSTSITGVNGSVSTSTSIGNTYLNDPYYMPYHGHDQILDTFGLSNGVGGLGTPDYLRSLFYRALADQNGGRWYTSNTGGNGYHSHSASSSSSFSFSSGSASSSFTGSAPLFTGTAHTHTGGTFTGTAHTHTSGAFTGVAHTHTGGTFTGTAINLAVKYVDVIIATKD